MPTATEKTSASGLLLVVLAGLSLVTSCGSDDDAEPAETTAASSTAAETDGAEDDDTADGAESDYPPFQDIDVATSPLFAALADTDLPERLGEQEIYERAVTICRDFDNGTTVDAEIDRLLAAGFGEDTPLLMAAAVTGLCPQHIDATTG